jgi:hypothetical protein
LALKLVLPFIIAGAFVSSAGLAAPAFAATPHASAVAVVNCQHKAVVRPASFIISCADANRYLQQISWVSWGAKTARAHATYTENSCTPYCAAGKFVNYTATVTLSLPKTVRGKRVFTKLHVSYVSGTTTKVFDFALLT